MSLAVVKLNPLGRTCWANTSSGSLTGHRGTPIEVITQEGSPWGLQRMSSTERLPMGSSPLMLGYRYQYTEPEDRWHPVNVYILDSGVQVEHAEFGGRARFGANLVGGPDIDDLGHGTHVAGTVGGTRVGVAKAVQIIAVKVGNMNAPRVMDVIAGINWAIRAATASNVPSIINLSIGYRRVQGQNQNALDALDKAVTNAVAAGLHVVVAAGNANTDASNYSPARVPEAITVGAADITDMRPAYSNFGPSVDIFAPGHRVISAASDTARSLKFADGTSMAAPHVAGALACFIWKYGDQPPQTMRQLLLAAGVPNAIGNMPNNMPTRMLQND